MPSSPRTAWNWSSVRTPFCTIPSSPRWVRSPNVSPPAIRTATQFASISPWKAAAPLRTASTWMGPRVSASTMWRSSAATASTFSWKPRSVRTARTTPSSSRITSCSIRTERRRKSCYWHGDRTRTSTTPTSSSTAFRRSVTSWAASMAAATRSAVSWKCGPTTSRM